MGKYHFTKKVYLYATLGLDFYEDDHDALNSTIIPVNGDPFSINNTFLPDSKGGYVYGIGVGYFLTKKVPVVLDYKILEASEIHFQNWQSLDYKRCSIQIGYKF